MNYYPDRAVFTEPDFTCTRTLPGRDPETGICGTCGAKRNDADPHADNCRRYELENPHLTGRYWGVEPVTYLTLGAAMARVERLVNEGLLNPHTGSAPGTSTPAVLDA